MGPKPVARRREAADGEGGHVTRTVVLNVVGLTPSMLGKVSTPQLTAWARCGKMAYIGSVLPAVTCSVQSTYLTGVHPNQHGIVGNGWYFRDECEVKFWRQSNRLVEAEKLWERARRQDPNFSCANLFWWYNMYSSVDYSVTPRPMYLANGLKVPDVYTQPSSLRQELQTELGAFPLFKFWGPATTIECTQWISGAAKYIEQRHRPTLTLIYLPHLDYGLQRHGPASPLIEKDLRDIDEVCGDLIRFYEEREANVIVLSEYGIAEVSTAIHLNRLFREHGLITVREELGREMLDAGASRAFAVADHQVAHVYINDPTVLSRVHGLLESTAGIGRVLDAAGKREQHLDHPRSGDLVAVARPGSWFSYYYWWDDRRAPDYARTVDIHRKPGYDPAELFIDPSIRLAKLHIGGYLLKKRLKIRSVLEVIPLDASLVKGSHGRQPESALEGPIFITTRSELLPGDSIDARDVGELIVSHLG